eukprot:7976-Heterococcus_DN1.PRE.3
MPAAYRSLSSISDGAALSTPIVSAATASVNVVAMWPLSWLCIGVVTTTTTSSTTVAIACTTSAATAAVASVVA